jgi:hypothetical protein
VIPPNNNSNWQYLSKNILNGKNCLEGVCKEAGRYWLALPHRLLRLFSAPNALATALPLAEEVAQILLESLQAPELAKTDPASIEKFFHLYMKFIIIECELRKLLRFKNRRTTFNLQVYLEKMALFCRRAHGAF